MLRPTKSVSLLLKHCVLRPYDALSWPLSVPLPGTVLRPASAAALHQLLLLHLPGSCCRAASLDFFSELICQALCSTLHTLVCAPGAACVPDPGCAPPLQSEHERPAAVAGELAPEASTSNRAEEDKVPRDVVRPERGTRVAGTSLLPRTRRHPRLHTGSKDASCRRTPASCSGLKA